MNDEEEQKQLIMPSYRMIIKKNNDNNEQVTGNEEDRLLRTQEFNNQTNAKKTNKTKIVFCAVLVGFVFLLIASMIAYLGAERNTMTENQYAEELSKKIKEEEENHHLNMVNSSAGGEMEETQQQSNFLNDKINSGWNATDNLIKMYNFCKTTQQVTLYDRANCGSDYMDLIKQQQEYRVNHSVKYNAKKIVIVGDSYNHVAYEQVLYLSGCPVGARGGPKCPYDQNCFFTQATTAHKVPRDAYMVVINNMDIDEIHQLGHSQHHILKTLYTREAVWPYVSRGYQNLFDLTMGVHFNRSGVLNPWFVLHPHDMLQGGLSDYTIVHDDLMKQKSDFALSIMSDCDTHSKREAYQDFLADYLGAHRIHRYGACGNRHIKRDDPKGEYRLLSKYKFYFAFENSLQNGYVTEKLYSMLMFPIIPVYYGASDVPKITKTKSYIKVSDFPNPRELAKYLLFLDQNDDEYLKYHEWRSAKNPSDKFDEDFLKYLSLQVPSPTELVDTYLFEKHTTMEHLAKTGVKDLIKLGRTASCCRLCNEAAVAIARAIHKQPNKFIEPIWPQSKILHKYFHGFNSFTRQPGKGHVLVGNFTADGSSVVAAVAAHDESTNKENANITATVGDDETMMTNKNNTASVDGDP